MATKKATVHYEEGDRVTWHGKSVEVVEVEDSGQVCIRLPDGSTQWVSPSSLTKGGR